VVLWFSLMCILALFINYLSKGAANRVLFSVYRSSPFNPLTYLRLFFHVLGHADMDHLLGNVMMVLVIGPLLEEKYGSLNIIIMIVATALVTGIANIIFFPHAILGASGVVFAMILLASFTRTADNTIPLTFILVAVVYIGGQVMDAVAVQDNVSNLTHILGGAVGAVLGYVMNASY
jgi:GlpG protein